MAQTQPSPFHELSLSLSLSLWLAWFHHCRPYTQASISYWHIGQTAVCIIPEFRYFITHRQTQKGTERLNTPED
jgi:hypothetical protein